MTKIKEFFKKLVADKKRRGDIILIASILVVGLSALLLFALTQRTGDRVVVKVDGKQIAEYSLSVDGIYYIEGYDGGTNVLVIEDGKAYMKEASCPKNQGDVACVHQGKKSIIGESIICRPNRVIVEIVGEGDEGLI